VMMRKGIVPQMTRQEGMVRAGVSTIALVLIVLVVPIGLLLVGGLPFSHFEPGQTARMLVARRTFDSGLMVHWILRGSLFIAWISWLWMTICVIVEFKSWITGRSTTELPASRTMQSVAACLVGTALALSTAGREIPFVGSNAAYLRVIDDSPSVLDRQTGLMPDPASILLSTGDLAPPNQRQGMLISSASRVADRQLRGPSGFEGNVDLEQSESRARQGHLVMPRETLWSIAADRLGSGLRWKELARDNYGIPQADGGILTEEHWVRPGWTLVLPQDHQPVGPCVSGVEATEARNPSSDQSPLPAQPAEHSSPSSKLLGSATPLAGDALHSFRAPNAPFTPIGAGVVGAGVVGLLDRLRRVQQRHRSRGAYIKLPQWPQVFIEQRLRIGDGAEITRTVDSALRLFSREWCDSDADVPMVNGVIVRPHSIEMAIDTIEAVSGSCGPFTVDRAGRSVQVNLTALARSGVPGKGVMNDNPPAPLLVTAGLGPNGLVLVNLESLGTLFVTGDPTGCEGVVRALALELATSFWSDRFDLCLVGFGAEFERFDRVESVNDVPSILDTICRRRIRAHELLQTTGYSSFARARITDQSHRWDPLAVICGPTVAQEDLAELLELMPDSRLGIAIVAIGESPGESRVLRLSGSDRESSLEVLGSIVSPQHVEADDLTGITELINTARSRESTLLSEEPYVNLPIQMPAPAATESTESTEPPGTDSNTKGRSGVGSRDLAVSESNRNDHEVEVAVLGQVEIWGAAREFTRAWSKELVVYLAMHPNGVTNEAWATALWPDRLMAPSSLHSTASVARRSLGRSRSGIDHLPHSHGRLTLADTVGTDWDRFVVLADSDDPGSWRLSLDLVRGRPFEGLRSSDWPILEGIGPAIESAVVDLSGRLAGACLSREDPRGAEWAARKGLLVSPYDERLYRMLMRAADLGGNPAGVESVMCELVKLVGDDIEPLDSVHPSTMELYRSLTRRRSAARWQ
jgi:hypothetical protein